MHTPQIAAGMNHPVVRYSILWLLHEGVRMRASPSHLHVERVADHCKSFRQVAVHLEAPQGQVPCLYCWEPSIPGLLAQQRNQGQHQHHACRGGGLQLQVWV